MTDALKTPLKWQDLPHFPQAHYEIDVDWWGVEVQLKYWSDVAKYTLILDPDYQRDHVWTPEQQTRFVEYIICGGEVSKTIYFNCPAYGGFLDAPNALVVELVDGKQRLQAVRQFMRGEVSVFGGHTIEDFEPRSRQIVIGKSKFKFRIAGLTNRADILRWYLAINFGGTAHTQAEFDRVNALLAECESTSGKKEAS